MCVCESLGKQLAIFNLLLCLFSWLLLLLLRLLRLLLLVGRSCAIYETVRHLRPDF